MRLETLPLSEPKQKAFLGYALTNKEFFLQVCNAVAPTFFSNQLHSIIWGGAVSYYKKYKKKPSLDEVRNLPGLQKLPPRDKGAVMTELGLAQESMNLFSLEPIRDEVETWLHAKIFSDGLDKATNFYNSEKFAEAYLHLRSTIRSIDQTKLHGDGVVDWSDPMALIARHKMSMEDACPFGLRLMDKLMLPEGVSGGMLKGDTTVLMSPSNVGKTSAILTVLRHNFMAGKRVLFLFHEGTELDLQTKFWQGLLGCTKGELEYIFDKEKDKVATLCKDLAERVVWVPSFGAGLTVEQVEGTIRRRIDEYQQTTGHNFDLLADDYPGKLTTVSAKAGNFAFRNVYQYVYNYFVQFANEYKFHCLLAIQTNREGSKINKNQSQNEDQRLLDLEDVHESFGPMQDVANVLTLNRDEVAESKDRLTYKICKSRSNEKGWAVVAKTNYKHAITHSDHLGAAYYKGSSTMADRVDQLLEQYNSTKSEGRIPQSEVF